MRLSEAIRLGAMLRPRQEFGTVFDPNTGGSCAIGAAAEAIGLLDTTEYNRYLDVPPDERIKAILKGWKGMCQLPCECPMCGEMWEPIIHQKRDVQGIVVHLNNDHRWTRDRIADWVEMFEQSHGQPASVDAVRGPSENPS